MQWLNLSDILVEKQTISSVNLQREVEYSYFIPPQLCDPSATQLLLINDGQNMEELGLERMLESLYATSSIRTLICVAISAGENRKMEYGVAASGDYAGRGNKAGLYSKFILEELLPAIRKRFDVSSFAGHAFAGFSMGGLTAFDISWNHPELFSKVGVFSGSLWWRSVDQVDPNYDDNLHRIIHREVREGEYKPGLKFFFQCGNKDETKDRNNNGIIDSIDDTLDLVKELVAKGYDRDEDIFYLELPDGRHDIATWARAMPEFLTWGWGRSNA